MCMYQFSCRKETYALHCGHNMAALIRWGVISIRNRDVALLILDVIKRNPLFLHKNNGFLFTTFLPNI